MTVPRISPGFPPIGRLRRAGRIAAAAALLVAVAYAAMPLWLPRGWIVRQLADELSAQLRRPVSIGRMTIGWGSGLVLEDIAVGERPGGPNAYLATISRVRCAFQPLRRLLGGQVPQLQISNLHIWLVADEQGHLNIDDLRDRRGGRLPTLRYRLDDVTLQIRTPQVEQRFRIDSLDCTLDRGLGALRLFAATGVVREQADGAAAKPRVSMDARVKVPRLKRGETLQGQIRIIWQDLALTDLPVPLIARLPVEQLAGTSTGNLSLSTHPDLTMDFDLEVAMRGVRVAAPALGRTAQVPDARLGGTGHVDPNGDALEVRTLWWESPGLTLRGRAVGQQPCLLLDIDADPALTMRVQGEVRDWVALRRELPAVDAWAQQAGLQAQGPLGFQADASIGRSAVSCEAALDGLRCSLTAAPGGRPVLRLAAGSVKQLKALATLDRRSGRLSVRRADLRLAGLRLAGTAHWTLPQAAGRDETSSAVTATARWPVVETVWRADAMGEVLRMLPVVGEFATGLEWSGPFEGEFKLTPAEGGSRLTLSCAVPAESRLRCPPLLDKGPGIPARLDFAARVPEAQAGEVEDLALRLALGGASLRLDPGGRLRFRGAGEKPDFQALLNDLELEWDLGWSVDRLEEFLGCSPAWAELSARHCAALRGALRCHMAGAGRVASGTERLEWRATLDAALLAARWREWVDKPAGEPLVLECSGRADRRTDEEEFMAELGVEGRFGRLEGSVLRSEGGAAAPDAGHASLEARIASISELQRLSPALAEMENTFFATGGLIARIDDVIVGENHHGRVQIEAENLGLRLRQAGWGKDAGVPGRLDVRWRLWPDDFDGRGGWTVEVDRAEACLAGLSVDRAGVSVAVRPGISGETGWVPLGRASLEARPGFFSAHGRVCMDEGTRGLSPELAAAMDAAELNGRAAWRLKAWRSEGGLAFSGRLDACETGIRLRSDHPLLPVVSKPASLPAVVEWAGTLPDGPWPDGAQVRLYRVRMNLDGNEATFEGEMTASGSRLDGVSVVGPCTIAMRLINPPALGAVLEGSPLQLEDGCLEAEVGMLGGPERARLTSLACRADAFHFRIAGEPGCLDGDLSLGSQDARIEHLAARLGSSCAAISGDLRSGTVGPTARVGVNAGRVDVPDLLRVREAIASSLAVGGADDGDRLAAVLDWLAASRLTLEGFAGQVRTPLPGGVEAAIDALTLRLESEYGPLNLTFTSLVDGGVVTGEVQTRLDVDEPMVYLTYEARDIQPGPMVDAYLAASFVGMKASGPLTLIDESYQRLRPPPGDPNYPTGRGEFMIHGGTISGRAAPKWLTQVFPGLDLASFDFTFMHAWFEKLPSGRQTHQMIFQGRYYNLYMIGFNEPATVPEAGPRDRQMRYEVGLDFLADFDSRYWAESGQGRVPLFTKTALVRTDLGALENEAVRFLPPQRILETLFVRNNPVVTAYHAVRKRVLGEQ